MRLHQSHSRWHWPSTSRGGAAVSGALFMITQNMQLQAHGSAVIFPPMRAWSSADLRLQPLQKDLLALQQC